ncbi:protein SPA1-RELATED 2-like isoform X2 [Magnolia sinica]|uniref:protein SPA1-RELATED 2-like isoform X2 n=1 Tax=Magnolia sinica TaxID=86752 RepID=UPI002658777D|nr:protein SPA1-RELATED 2-like isoform X2 [Magnolia sinica]
MEGTGDVNAVIETVAQLKGKEINPSLQLDSCNAVESPTMFVSQENDWVEPVSSLNLPEVFTETLEGKILTRCVGSDAGSEHPTACTFNDSGVMVEELTLKNYKGSDLSNLDCSNNREEMQLGKGQWQNLYQLTGAPWKRNLHGDVVSKEPMPSGGAEDVGNMFLPRFCVQRPLPNKHPDDDHAHVSEHLINSDNCNVLNNALVRVRGGIRTKVLPASGFSQFFVNNTLKGKGVVYRHFGTREGSGIPKRGQNSERAIYEAGVAANTSPSSAKAKDLSTCSSAGAAVDLVHHGISLREWLKPGNRRTNKGESLRIFKQIVELVDLAHSQGIALKDIRPSCFMILPSDKVKYVGSCSPRIETELSESVINGDSHYSKHHSKRKMDSEQGTHPSIILSAKRQDLSEHVKYAGQHPRFSAGYGMKHEKFVEDDTKSFTAQNSGCNFGEAQNLGKGHWTRNMPCSPNVSKPMHQQLMSESRRSEERWTRWYSSPEELNDGTYTLSSNIYSLGVLLFELFCCFESWEMHAAAMSNLQHRILPPNFLSENPKEAGFCLWLLHPKPSSRPKTREILQSEVICENRDLSFGDQSSLPIDEENAESELLLHFLTSLKEQKQNKASKLAEDLECLKADIEEAEKRHSLRTEILSGSYKKDVLASFSDKCLHNGPLSLEVLTTSSSRMDEARLMRNISQLESAYFSMRTIIGLPETDTAARSDKDVLKNQHRWSSIQNDNEDWCMNKKPTDRLGAFFEGICKYARYSKFEVRGALRNVDLLNSANVICSLSFDRDEDFFAAAGVSKKIKIFEYSSLFNDTVDIHYPVVEMSSRSKLSCVCWNSYIKNYLASTDYDGVVQLWDASTGQGFSQYTEHQKRAWSVDFSQVDPTKLASGSDDCSVKLWSINEKNSISMIRNVANACCVQFSPHSSHLLAFGSADYKVYCYDLRHTRIPWCTLAGHGKAVSYVKFLDPYTVVSASTDNTLKLWDLNNTVSSELSTSACSLTLSGHMNEKNFVGLSVSDSYIACGSETNEVYAYYRSLPMPVTSHKFGSIDPISGQETVDDNGQFVSSVCWRGKSNMVVAANSNGTIKLLQMV